MGMKDALSAVVVCTGKIRLCYSLTDWHKKSTKTTQTNKPTIDRMSNEMGMQWMDDIGLRESSANSPLML